MSPTCISIQPFQVIKCFSFILEKLPILFPRCLQSFIVQGSRYLWLCLVCNCVMVVRRVHKSSAVMLLVIVSLLLIIGNIPLKIKQARRSRSDHSDLGRTKNLSFMVKALYFQGSGRTNNCQIEVLFKWSDQSCTPSGAPVKISNRSKDLFSEESTTAENGMDKNGLDLDKICPTDGGHITYYNLPKIDYRPSTGRQFFKSRLCMYSNTSCCITCQLQSDSSIYRILLSGDISLNPGPVRWPCSVCGKAVATNHRAIQCDNCDKWCHISRKCGNVSLKDCRKFMNDSINSLRWYCPPCTNQNLNNRQIEMVEQLRPRPSHQETITSSLQSGDNNIEA